MPVIKETVHGPLKTVYYEESPLMSTYLVAIVVGLFDYIEGSTLEGRISVSVSIVCSLSFKLYDMSLLCLVFTHFFIGFC